MINIEWRKDTLVLLDQTKLPTEITYVHCTDWRQVAEAIKMLRVRGAPAIGVAASYGLILACLLYTSSVPRPSRIALIKYLLNPFAC